MDNYILLIQCILLATFGSGVYMLFGKKMTSPTFISSMIFSIGSMIAFVGNKDWKMPVYWNTVLVIFLGLLSMFAGEYFVRVIYQSRYESSNCNSDVTKKSVEKVVFVIPSNVIMFVFVIGVIADVLYYIRMCQISGVSITDVVGMLSTINYARHSSEESTGVLIACLNVILSLSWGCLTCAYINNMTILKKTNRIYNRYLIIWIPYIINIIIGGSRIYFVSILSFVVFCILIFQYRYNRSSQKENSLKSIFKFLLIGMAGFYIVFSFMGQLSGKIGDSSSATSSFMIYAGSSIIDLGIYLKRGIVRSNIPGANTFMGVFNTLGRIISIPTANNVGLGYIKLSTGVLTNIYTAFAAYIADFGYVGFVVLQLILGMAYTIVFLYLINVKRVSLPIFTYWIMFLYGLVGQLFAPETVSGILSVNDIFRLGCIIIVVYIFGEKSIYIINDYIETDDK